MAARCSCGAYVSLKGIPALNWLQKHRRFCDGKPKDFRPGAKLGTSTASVTGSAIDDGELAGATRNAPAVPDGTRTPDTDLVIVTPPMFPIVENCAHCGREFPPVRLRFGRPAYCSNACRQAAYRARKLAAKEGEGVPA